MEINDINVQSYPGSEKAYLNGKIHDIKVPMRRVNLTPTVKIVDGERVVQKMRLYMYMIPAACTLTRM